MNEKTRCNLLLTQLLQQLQLKEIDSRTETKTSSDCLMRELVTVYFYLYLLIVQRITREKEKDRWFAHSIWNRKWFFLSVRAFILPLVLFLLPHDEDLDESDRYLGCFFLYPLLAQMPLVLATDVSISVAAAWLDYWNEFWFLFHDLSLAIGLYGHHQLVNIESFAGGEISFFSSLSHKLFPRSLLLCGFIQQLLVNCPIGKGSVECLQVATLNQLTAVTREPGL